MLIIAVFIVGSYLAHNKTVSQLLENVQVEKNALIWGTALIISLPFLIAIDRKLKGLSMIVAEMAMKTNVTNEYSLKLRRTIAQMIPVLGMLGIILMIIALSASILPPIGLLILVLVIVTTLAAILWPWFIKFHSRLQIAFMERFKKDDHHS